MRWWAHGVPAPQSAVVRRGHARQARQIGAGCGDVDVSVDQSGHQHRTAQVLWQTFLRRFDLEHTFRFLKQTLGWTRPRLRSPEAADRWSWLIVAVYTQLRLARGLVEDQPRPWQPRTRDPRQLTPARVRRGFRNIRPIMGLPARVPRPSRPGSGRPPGSPNKHPAAVCHVGKTTKKDTTVTAGAKQTS